MTDVATGRDSYGDHTIRNKLVFCDDIPSVRTSESKLSTNLRQ
jgi:hypothetical protein